VVLLGLALPASAANPAYDNASSYAYIPGWLNGSNGGYGFAPWQLSVLGGIGGHFIFTSVANGDGLDNGIVGGVAGDSDIDTFLGPSPDVVPWPPANVTVARSWGMWSGGGVTDAIRPFTAGPLTIGQTFQVDFDNGFVPNGNTIGVGLYNAANQPLWEVLFFGGGANYVNNDAAGLVPTTVPYGDEGLNVIFTLTGAATYTMTLTRRDGVSQVINGNLINVADQNIAQFRAFTANGIGDEQNDFFINSMSVIPEPSTTLLVGIGMLTLCLIRRRRS
jgi:hypothetical protein